ncbi:glycoside hydrolase family 2 protein [Deinococcus yavapaiensis]|nr:glycoside hydrolase family 2 TIM barrel-domain containing protein [Deinococcus yavapaiensis]
MHDDPHYPRPQLRRPEWRDLSGPWRFAFDDENSWRAPGDATFDREIQVPFPPESELSGLRETGYHAVVWYARRVDLSEAERPVRGERRLVLHFGAVDYRASVWVDGHLVATHEGGHTPFSADISEAVGRADGFEVVVRAEDDPRDLAQPRGKQDWQEVPHVIWYHRTTGIWQTVWLEVVPDMFVERLKFLPDVDRGELRLTARFNRDVSADASVHVKASLRGNVLARQVVYADGREAHAVLGLRHTSGTPERHDLLWSPKRPNLIDVEIELRDASGAVIDRVESYAGLRSAEVRDGQFLLNGFPYYLRLVLAQNYWPQSHLAAPSPGHLQREVELVKELGFNGVRIHQKIEDPRFLYWCDRVGLVVWGEIANAYVFDEDAQLRLTSEWLEAVRRDFNHPCVVAWVPLNESWGVPNLERDALQRHFVKGLYHLTKSLDPTRPVIGNDGWQHVAGDILGIHDYAFTGDVLRERYGSHEQLAHTFERVQPHFRRILTDGHTRRGEAVMLTEFGGLSLRPAESERWWGYGTVGSPDELLEKYRELVAAVLESNVLMGFCYTQLTDTEQETNGLLRADRTPKVDPAKLRAVNVGFAHSVPGDVINEIHTDAQRRDADLRKNTE